MAGVKCVLAVAVMYRASMRAVQDDDDVSVDGAMAHVLLVFFVLAGGLASSAAAKTCTVTATTLSCTVWSENNCVRVTEPVVLLLLLLVVEDGGGVVRLAVNDDVDRAFQRNDAAALDDAETEARDDEPLLLLA